MGDPIAAASGVCFLVAAFSLLGGLVIGGAGLGPGWLAALCLAEGLVYFALGIGIRRESRACAWIAAILYTLSTASLLKAGLAGGLVLRAIMVIQLWRAASQIEDLNAADAKAEARRAGGGWPAPGGRAPAPVARPVYASPRPVVVLATAAVESGSPLEPRGRGPRPSRGVRLCMTCKSEHASAVVRCPTCRRDLFDA